MHHVSTNAFNVLGPQVVTSSGKSVQALLQALATFQHLGLGRRDRAPWQYRAENKSLAISMQGSTISCIDTPGIDLPLKKAIWHIHAQ